MAMVLKDCRVKACLTECSGNLDTAGWLAHILRYIRQLDERRIDFTEELTGSVEHLEFVPLDVDLQ